MTPEAEETPEATVTPEAEATPEATVTPEAEETPEATVTPEAETTPEATVTPEAETTPEATVTPEAETTPEATVTPEAEATPETTVTPEAEETPEPTVTPEAEVTPEADKDNIFDREEEEDTRSGIRRRKNLHRKSRKRRQWQITAAMEFLCLESTFPGMCSSVPPAVLIISLPMRMRQTYLSHTSLNSGT